MALIDLLILLIIIGVILYLVNTVLPMDANLKRIVNIVVVVVVCLWLIRLLLPGVANVHL